MTKVLMDTLLPIAAFSRIGQVVMAALFLVSSAAGLYGGVNLCRKQQVFEKAGSYLLIAANLLFLAGFMAICWFHYQIYHLLPLELPDNLASWLNGQLAAMNQGAEYAMPLYNAASPPRYAIPVWIENEKYFFWFMCYAVMALIAHNSMRHHRLRAALHIFLAVQVALLFFSADPFANPLPRFMNEVAPWFEAQMLPPMARIGLFMKLYPRMIFYYNAEYMWLHPPLLFLSYACITLTFVACIFMLIRREQAIEKLAYDYAKLGYFMLTLGMLLGYPWALKAWGPNWWWDPKICSSIMMWAVFSTYLHTRLYANKKGMWYFSALLGILCFVAMIFTFLTSFYFPGEHTFQ